MKIPHSLAPLAICLMAFLASLSPVKGVIFSEDFQSDTPGTIPASAASVDGVPPNSVRVLDASSTPADPFGGEGNKSLMLEMTTTGVANIPRVNWMTSEPITVATYIFDAYTYSGAGFTTPLLAFFTYRNDLVAANTGVRFFISGNGSIRVGDGGAFVTASNQWTHNTVNHVKVTVYEDQTYSLTINGVTVSYMVNQEEKNGFLFRQPTPCSPQLISSSR